MDRLSRASLSGDCARSRLARGFFGYPEGLVLYCGRHDYGTRVLKQTGNLKAVMLTMGHKDVKTAMRYQHPEVEVVRQASISLADQPRLGPSNKGYGTLCGTPQKHQLGKSLKKNAENGVRTDTKD
jgi:hypothetical protein